jgi:beta-lactamase superfamily II metal-dependent hydrolase
VLETLDLSENDKSLVSLIEFGNSRILLCSDIEETAQKRILQLYPDLRCDVMIVPHHGSINTLDVNFTDKLDGQIYICICDSRQFERLQGKNQGYKTGWFYTARDGAIKVAISAKGDISVVRSRQEKPTNRKIR